MLLLGQADMTEQYSYMCDLKKTLDAGVSLERSCTS